MWLYGVVGVYSLYIVWRRMNFFFFFGDKEIYDFFFLNKSFILIILNGISVSENEFLSSM